MRIRPRQDTRGGSAAITRRARGYTAGAALVVVGGIVAPSLRAQTPEPTVYRGCYVPSSGSIYRIGAAGTPSACTKSTHVEFTWNQTGPQGPAGATGPAGPPGGACDNGCVTTASLADGAVTDAKLSTITAAGKIANSATTATSASTSSAIVARDGAGDIRARSLHLDMGGQLTIGFEGRMLYRGGLATGTSVFVGLGAGPGSITNEEKNVGVGERALAGLGPGSGNTAVGYHAGPAGGSINNVAIGQEALEKLVMASMNVAVGWRALAQLTNGPGNIAIGHNAGVNLTGSESSNIYIGHPGVAGESGTARIARIHGATVATGTAVIISADGKLGTVSSSARFKTDVRDLGDASAALYRLRPVAFRYRPELDSAGTLQYGLVAEEVERVAPELVAHDSAGRVYTVRYQLLVPMLLNELQRQQRQREAQSAELRRLEERLARLEAVLKR